MTTPDEARAIAQEVWLYAYAPLQGQGCLKVNSDAVFGELNASQREHSFDVVGQRAQSTAN